MPWFAGWGLTDDRHPFVAELIRQNVECPVICLSYFMLLIFSIAVILIRLLGMRGYF
ncbi:hypothetical protein INT80_15035 [Gallibacterium anatis]|uniref:Uncharacterized protein n=1 Tax=Gallibacterium anatis TaxID=750 RepID=A0A930Y5L7_9PAST|nr:hypothetical protein [Gallibacterium anatis]